MKRKQVSKKYVTAMEKVYDRLLNLDIAQAPYDIEEQKRLQAKPFMDAFFPDVCPPNSNK